MGQAGIMDAMQFFESSAGTWHSQRTTHHLPFRRAELGGSAIQVEALPADDDRVAEICKLHDIDPSQAAGGAFVQWSGSMQWDREDDENHAGSTVFAIVPDADDPTKGKMLRERGYAEIVPVAGQFEMDAEGGLTLITEYETMSSIERFWFASPDVRMRTSTVKRFGGFSTATFCTENRLSAKAEPLEVDTAPIASKTPSAKFYSVFGW
jgi:hypothetical protein